MDLGLKKRVDDGEMVEYASYYNGKWRVLNACLFRNGKKYTIELDGILKKANYSFNVISKELDLLKAVHNLKEI